MALGPSGGEAPDPVASAGDISDGKTAPGATHDVVGPAAAMPDRPTFDGPGAGVAQRADPVASATAAGRSIPSPARPARPRPGAVRYWLAGRFYRLAFEEWGGPTAPTVVCVHGLTRNGRDFDGLATELADRFRVICPDLPGRGASDWLADPMLYQAQHYVAALSHLLAWIGTDVSWVGTSLGGICGMVIAAASDTPVTKLVLNDIQTEEGDAVAADGD